MALPADPAAACAELRALADRGPANGAFEIVVEALDHRREGVQVRAAQVLRQWGRHEAVAPLLRWLGRVLARHIHGGPAWQAAFALATCVDGTDTDWILDTYFAHPPNPRGHYLIQLVTALPARDLRPRLKKELCSQHAKVRTAALIATNLSRLEDRAVLIALLRHDPDKSNANLAGVFLRLLSAAGSRP